MKVLVTGLNGFTGRYLGSELESHGYDVVGLEADLLDATALAHEVFRVSPTAVVHLAGVAFADHHDASDFYRVNLIGTRNLLAALAACSARPDCVLLASSANVYGVSGEALTENTRPNPMNDYAVSKLAMEYMARLWLEQLPVVIVRPFNYTGVGQDDRFLIPKIVAHFRKRESEIELGNLDVWRDFSDVRTVAEVYRRLLEIAPVGEIVNISSGRSYSLREIVDMAGSITGHTLLLRVDPALVRENEVRVLRGDNLRLKSLIGETVTFRPLEETLRWMLSGSS
ncbi:MAG: NAD-dependent epimerase/dehydratase family protein [Zoogloeaceae bacterium]|jgi:nucleoside-diphosphate-sugar epimerase|nr:NAD-dependent epimerase/dehydratase family protein [Zoogloeaceae bacterium]